MQARNILIATAIKHKGEWESIYKDIKNKEYPSEEELAQTEKVECITPFDEEYPDELKQVFKMPLVLFTKGNKELLNNENKIALLGIREPDNTTKTFTEKLMPKLKGKTIITTLNRGTDTKVIENALKCGNPLIVVMASGIDYCYPSENKELYEQVAQKGLLISEYPFNELPQQETFMASKRIIAGLCEKLCVLELRQHSGALMTVNYALSLGKDIYCKSNPINEEDYCNDLLDEGALPLTLNTQL